MYCKAVQYMIIWHTNRVKNGIIKYLTISRKEVRLLRAHYSLYIYSMVGWSIASISNLGYGPPYHTICILYSTVGRSIADISDLGGVFTLALCASVRYIGYRPPYCTIQYAYSMVGRSIAKVGYRGYGPTYHTINI